MNEPTPSCPVWCTWQHSPIHVEGDVLADEPDAVVRTHARNVGDVEVAGHLIGVDIVQEVTERGDVQEFAPVVVDLTEIEDSMTTREAREVAALLLRAADAAEAVAR